MNFQHRTILFVFGAITAAAVSAALASQPAVSQAIPDAPQATADVPNGPSVVMDTSMGRITCQFYQKQAPKAVANFIGLATGSKDWTHPATHQVMHHKPYFDGTTFHRVIPEFMIQGGDPTGTGTGDAGYKFNDEFDPGLNFDRPGRLAMANSGPNTNGSQFFITEQATPFLNQHYTLFGQCDDASVAVVKTIARVQRDGSDKPLTPVVLKKVTIVPAGQPMPPMPGNTAHDEIKVPKLISISADAAAALLIQETAPVYPLDAKNAGVAGTVILEAIIGVDGRPNDLKVIQSPAPLQQAALDAVRTWRYRPYLLNGQPVEFQAPINVIFTLAD